MGSFIFGGTRIRDLKEFRCRDFKIQTSSSRYLKFCLVRALLKENGDVNFVKREYVYGSLENTS